MEKSPEENELKAGQRLPAPICYGSWRHDCPPLGEDMQDEDDGDGFLFGSDDVLISISGSRVAIGAFFRENRGDYWLEWTSTYVPLGEKESVDGWMPLPAPFCHNTQGQSRQTGANDE